MVRKAGLVATEQDIVKQALELILEHTDFGRSMDAGLNTDDAALCHFMNIILDQGLVMFY